MSSLAPVIGLSLTAALAFAVSSTLKHLSAAQVPDAQDLRPGSVGAFTRATLTHPLWLGGIAADAVGLALQVAALRLGALTVVQPLLVTGLLFALLLRQLTAGRVSAREMGWAVVLVAALSGFLLLAGTAATTTGPAEPPDRVPAVVAGVAGLVLAAVCVRLGRGQSRAGRAAALLGVAVGTVYAATAALLKALTTIAGAQGLPALLSSWQLWTVLVLGATGLLLNQLAFQAGPLSAALPAIATVDPLLSIVIGVAVYDEHLRSGPGPAAGLAALLVLLGVAVIALSRHEPAPTTRTGAPAPSRPAGA